MYFLHYSIKNMNMHFFPLELLLSADCHRARLGSSMCNVCGLSAASDHFWRVCYFRLRQWCLLCSPPLTLCCLVPSLWSIPGRLVFADLWIRHYFYFIYFDFLTKLWTGHNFKTLKLMPLDNLITCQIWTKTDFFHLQHWCSLCLYLCFSCTVFWKIFFLF